MTARKQPVDAKIAAASRKRSAAPTPPAEPSGISGEPKSSVSVDVKPVNIEQQIHAAFDTFGQRLEKALMARFGSIENRITDLATTMPVTPAPKRTSLLMEAEPGSIWQDSTGHLWRVAKDQPDPHQVKMLSRHSGAEWLVAGPDLHLNWARVDASARPAIFDGQPGSQWRSPTTGKVWVLLEGPSSKHARRVRDAISGTERKMADTSAYVHALVRIPTEIPAAAPTIMTAPIGSVWEGTVYGQPLRLMVVKDKPADKFQRPSWIRTIEASGKELYVLASGAIPPLMQRVDTPTPAAPSQLPLNAVPGSRWSYNGRTVWTVDDHQPDPHQVQVISTKHHRTWNVEGPDLNLGWEMVPGSDEGGGKQYATIDVTVHHRTVYDVWLPPGAMGTWADEDLLAYAREHAHGTVDHKPSIEYKSIDVEGEGKPR